ncbi:MAG TPA: hypothetical protein VMT11_07535 [Myxococcaceae bacterium]|nr:hypothetical protein [Myxococcaceae bacterium]
MRRLPSPSFLPWLRSLDRLRGAVLVSFCVVAGASSGCSFWATRPPSRSELGGGGCTTSAAAPVVDGVLGAGFLGVGVAGASTQACQSCWVDLSRGVQTAGVVAIGLGLVEAAAATYGSLQVAACREARKQLEMPVFLGSAAPRPAP